MSPDPHHPRPEETQVESHPFKGAFHGREDGTPGYLSVESGYIVPSGFIGGFDAILPKFAGADLQDQRHTGELTHIVDPPVGDWYVEALGEWRTLGYDGENKTETFEPHTAEIKHHSQLDLTHEKKRALKLFRLESDGRVSQYIRSDIPMNIGRTVPSIPPWEEPPPGSDSDSSGSSSSSSGSSGSWTGWGSDSSSGSAPYKWATFVDDFYPPLIYPGVTSNVQVSLRNDGNVPWESTDQLLPIGYHWGILTIPVPLTYPGVTRDFNFSIDAPMAPGTYPFQFQLYGPGSYYGEQTPERDILVPGPPDSSSSAGSSGSSSSSGPPPYDAAAFVSQFFIPEEMYVDEEAWVQVVFRNVGTTVWETGMYKLIPMQYHWGNFEVALPTRALPGVERVFDITITAPSAPGTYYWRWAMEGPNGVFEQQGAEKIVIVSPRPTPPDPPSSSSSSGGSSGPPPPSDSGSGGSGSGIWEGSVSGENATFVSQIVPLDIPAGGSTSVEVTFRNVGEGQWTSGQHRLGAKIPDFNTFWNEGSVALPSTTYPGAERTFHFWIEAPETTGLYPWRWQLYNSATSTFFGQMSPHRVINVVPASDSGASSSSS